MSARPNDHRARPPRREEEGAVLLIVILILLMVTATATFAMRSTAAEVRAAGNARVAHQTGYLGESGLVAAMDWGDQAGPRPLVDILHAEEAAGRRLPLAPFEPPLAQNKFAHRFYLSDLQPGGITPEGVEGDSAPDPSIIPVDVFGSKNAYEPFVLVDVYDQHVYTGFMPGFVASGGAHMKHLRATYTARGRARLRDSALVDPSSNAASYHEASSDARAMAISGPFGM
jgi:hypothetical protein